MTSVVAGSRLGPYEVISRIGAGGMGEVFRARDTRLDRMVAIKILPREFADNAELRLRFEREAKTISQIAHPNICTLHDVGHADGVEYLVLEFLEGETLADRIARGPLPIAEVLRFGSQIASALDRAHRAGIVHRDLKPGNVMITKSGAKLLDFGLARSAGASVSITDVTQHKPLTQEGAILGTYQYMSPEQLAGEEVDQRTDIFSLGAVLYEMVTGVRAFEGKSRTSIATAIFGGAPRPASSVQPATPPALEHVIARCLAKERDERWQSAADVASELDWTATATTEAPGAAKRKRRVGLVAAALAALCLMVAGAIPMIVNVVRRLRIAERPVHSQLQFDEPLASALIGAVALSPDGTKLAVLAGSAGKPSLAIRNLANGETKILPGTEGAAFPFWSPDSTQAGFFAGDKLRTISAAGGSIQTLCDAKQARGGSWGRDGVIVFAPDVGTSIFKVDESGGTPVAVIPSDGKTHRLPTFLPDGKTFACISRDNGIDSLYAVSLDGKLRKRLIDDVSNAAFARGRIFFVRDGNLLSQPFDAAKLTSSGTLTPVADHVEYYKVRSIGNFSVTDSNLVYVNEASGISELVAVDRSGRTADLHATPARYAILAISPDGRTLVVAIYERFEQGDLWLVNTDNGSKSRLTFSSNGGHSGSFSHDGSQLAVSSGQFGQTISITVRSLTSNKVRNAGDFTRAAVVSDWSSDDKFLILVTQSTKSGFDIERLSVETGQRTPVVNGTPDEITPALSPNGKWLAYVSTESGAPQVYLTSFPSGEGKWQATVDGGTNPRWSPDGKELLFVKDNALVALAFGDGAVPQFGAQTPLPIHVQTDRRFIAAQPVYLVMPDGRILTTRNVGDSQPRIHLITNWGSKAEGIQ